MENMKNSAERIRKYLSITLLAIISFSFTGLNAQNESSVRGTIIEEKSKQPVPFATVCLMDHSTDSDPVNAATISDENGAFRLGSLKPGKYILQVRSIGYKTGSRSINIEAPGILDAGVIRLQDTTLLIEEAVVVGKRPAGKTEEDKTVYFINSKILGATGNAPGMLRHIPGIQVDLKQNIYLEGSRDILIYVNGIERDESYIGQLDPALIEKIEIMNTPPSVYDGDVEGVINIVLKKDKNAGISGKFFTDIPTSKSIVYSFPTASLNYGYNNLNLHLSYNGEINYEDIDETTYREVRKGTLETDITSIQQVRQKNLSHNLHYGFDYFLSSRDIINLYGSYNPYSWEQDGNVMIETTGMENHNWNLLKDETDRNINTYNSLYYKHLFNEKGNEISIDISRSSILSRNTTTYLNEEETGIPAYKNTQKPEQNSSTIKIDFKSPIGHKFSISTGTKARFKTMHDDSNDFTYRQQIFALYGIMGYKHMKNDFNIGVRAEKSVWEDMNEAGKSISSFLPYASFSHKINSRQSLGFSYRRSIDRPSIYLLNPYSYKDDPYTISKGNPLLDPELRNNLYLEHSIQFHGNYLSSRLFYSKAKDAINKLLILNDTSAFETRMHNLGNIHRYGIKLSGSFNFGPLTINSNIQLYKISTHGNDLARAHDIENRSDMVLESSLSSILSLKNNFAFSAIFQYSTPEINIQEKTFCDPLYFISLDKSFKNNIKAGIMTALPFKKSLVYQGSEIEEADFSSYYTGNLKLPVVPVMFRISYQFNAGKERTFIKRDKVEVEKKMKSGLK